MGLPLSEGVHFLRVLLQVTKAKLAAVERVRF
jgi:hypothetical protein